MKTAFLTLIFDFPVSLNSFSLFDIGTNKGYIDWDTTRAQFKKAYHSEYQDYFNEIIKATQKRSTPIALYLDGFFIEFLIDTDPPMIDALKKSVTQGTLELIGGTYNHSLSSLYSVDQFEIEVKTHKSLLEKTFDYKPVTFYNTENIYCNRIAEYIYKLGFKRTFAGAISWYLGSDNHERVFTAKGVKGFNVLIIDKESTLFDNHQQNIHFVHLNLPMLKRYRGLERVLLAMKGKAQLKPLRDCTQYNSKELYYIKTPTMGSLNGKTLGSFNSQAMQTNVLNMYYSVSEQAGTISNMDFISIGQANLYLTLNTESSDKKITFSKYNQLMNILNDADLKA